MAIKDMLGRTGVISREDALALLQSRFVVPELSSEMLPLSAAFGRILASDIISPSDLPEFKRSTMDGYAVRSSDTFGAAESRPALLKVVGDIPMGVMPDRDIAKGHAMKIATGGALPESADAVVMFEQTQQVDAETIEVVKAVGPGENVIQRGDDIKQGSLVLSRGHALRPQDLSACASLGITKLNVYRKPRVAIISTGNELVPAAAESPVGTIRDSNSINLQGLVLQTGAEPVVQGIVRDEYEKLKSALDVATSVCDLVILTGGSSVGTLDMTAKVINEAGKPGVLVHGVALKPGKPLIAGLVESSHGQVPVFGLPGHPVAVSVGFDLFVRPLLLRLTGEIPHPALAGVPRNRIVKARLSRSIASSPGREDHVRVTLEKREDGLWAKPVFGASGLISTLVNAMGTVVVPVNKIGIEAGEEVEVKLFS
jgi:molybdopterin molybdotransferase